MPRRPRREATSESYYAILGVERTASADELKRAYRKLALVYHPDRHVGKCRRGAHTCGRDATRSPCCIPGEDSCDEAEARFKLINEAYEVLSVSESRRKYDSQGPSHRPSHFEAEASDEDDVELTTDMMIHTMREMIMSVPEQLVAGYMGVYQPGPVRLLRLSPTPQTVH